MDVVWYIIAGIVSGVVAGMGMGGGTLLIPALTIFLSVEQQMAQGINLLAFLPTAIVALVIHCKNKLVDFKKGIPIIITGIFASIGGSILATNTQSRLLQILFGVFLLFIGVLQLVLMLVDLCKKKSKKNEEKASKKIKVIITGNPFKR